MKNEYEPTKEELVIINERFAKVPYKSVSDLYLFPAMIIDNQLTAYFTRMHPTFLEQCVKDLFDGVGFLVGHNRDTIPMARSFKGHLTSNGNVMEVFAKFFMQKDLTVNGVNTNDFMRAFLGGTVEDVSIGFAAKRYECSICQNDIRSTDCPHWPGKKYNDKDEVTEDGTLCFAWVMEPAGPKGEALLEVSTVYKGAAPEAKQKKASDVPKFIINLTEGKSLKEMPKEEVLAMNFNFSLTKGGKKVFDINKFFAGEYKKEELPECVDIDVILAQEVSEEETATLKDKFKDNIDQLVTLLKEYPAAELLISKDDVSWTREYINSMPDASFAVIEPAYASGETKNKNARHLPHHEGENIDKQHLKAALARMALVKPVTDSISAEDLSAELSGHLSQHESDLEGKSKLQIAEANNQVLLEQIGNLKTEIDGLKQVVEDGATALQVMKDANAQLQQEVESLKTLAEIGKACKEDLINEILGLGVRLQGNNYDVATNKKVLGPTDLANIKKIRDQFLQELDKRFPRKQSAGKPLNLPAEGDSGVPDEAYKQ